MIVPMGLIDYNSDKKRLLEPVVINSYVVIWRHYEQGDVWL